MLIKTQFTLQKSLLKDISHEDIRYKTLEKLLRFEQNISENNLFPDTFVYRRFKCRKTFVQKFIYTDNVFHIALVRAPSVEERLKVVFPTTISVSDLIFKELQNFINLNEELISV